MVLAWTLGLAALVVFTMLFYPTLSKSFSEALTNVPDSLKSFIGDSNAYKTIAGYTDVQIITQYAFMTLIFGVIVFTGFIAGEEGEGTLQTLLVQPVRRSRVYFEKLLSAMVLLGIVCLGIALGVLVSLPIIHEHIGIGRLATATLALWLITLVFSVMGYSIGAITGRRGFAGGTAGALAFVSLLISSLADSVKALKPADKFSPFHYFNKPGILQHGIHWSDLFILAAVCVVFIVIGAIIFNKRDVYQR
jgi:ABC-2 type transport system permease protein